MSNPERRDDYYPEEFEFDDSYLFKYISVKIISDLWENGKDLWINSGYKYNGVNLFFDEKGFYVTVKGNFFLPSGTIRKIAYVIFSTKSLAIAISKFKEVCVEQKRHYNGEYGSEKGINAKKRADRYVNGLTEEVGVKRLSEYDFSLYKSIKHSYDHCSPLDPWI